MGVRTKTISECIIIYYNFLYFSSIFDYYIAYFSQILREFLLFIFIISHYRPTVKRILPDWPLVCPTIWVGATAPPYPTPYAYACLSSLIIVKTTHPYSQNPLLVFHESESPTFLISLNLLTSHSILYWKRGEKRQNYVYVMFCTTRWWPGIAKDNWCKGRVPPSCMQHATLLL